jgi:hypothetical protein
MGYWRATDPLVAAVAALVLAGSGYFSGLPIEGNSVGGTVAVGVLWFVVILIALPLRRRKRQREA